MLFVKSFYGNILIPPYSVSKCIKMPFYVTGAKFGENRKKIKS